MTLKEQLQKTQEEFCDEWGECGSSPVYSDLGCTPQYEDIQAFIYQAQIEAVKAFVEEVRLQPKVWQDYKVDAVPKTMAYNRAVDDLDNKIDNLLKNY